MIPSRTLASVTLVAGALLVTGASRAATLTTLYSFDPNTFSVLPSGLSVYKGILYGTTFQGGASNGGTLYSVYPKNGSQKTLYSFSGSGDGLNPAAGVIDISGTLYGTTEQGGTAGTGTVYKFNTASKTLTVLHDFPNNIGLGNKDGAYPQSQLTYVKGTLYGTTTYGGHANQGTIFKVNASTGAESVVYHFAGGEDGAVPVAGMIYLGGSFYGVTQAGGAAGAGTVFKFTPSTRAEVVLYSFAGGSDGVGPDGTLVVYNNKLYGTTNQGGSFGMGTVFEIDPATGAETVLHSFAGAGEGAFPGAGLTVANGLLYGTTFQGGAVTSDNQTIVYDLGTIFSIDPVSAALQTTYVFKGDNNGALPAAGLALSAGVLYGTTTAAGLHSQGTVYSFVP